MTCYEDLVWRGLIQEISHPELKDKLTIKSVARVIIKLKQATSFIYSS